MPATSAQTLLLRIDSDMSKLRAELAESERATMQAGMKMKTHLNGVNDNFRALTSAAGLLRSVVGGLAAGAFAAMAARTFTAADALQDAAERASVTTEQLQALGYAAQQNGSSQEALNQSLVRFSKNVGEALAGTGEFLPVLQRYGIGVRFVNGQVRDQYGLLLDLADAIRRAESDQERARIAVAAFGRDGAELVPMLKNGAAGLEALGLRARELGHVFDKDVIKRASEAKDKMEALTLSFERAAQGIFLQLEPALRLFGQGFERVFAPTRAQQVEDLTRKIELLREQLELAQSPKARASARRNLDLARAAQFDLIEQGLAGGLGRTLGAGAAVEPPLPPLTEEMLRSSRSAVTYRSAQDKKLEEGLAESRRVLAEYDQAARKVFEGTRTPAERFLETQKQIDSHLEHGRIDMETYGRATKQAAETLAEGLNRELESGRIDWEQYRAAVAQAGLTMADIDAALYRTGQLTRALGNAFDTMFERMIASGGDWRSAMLGLLGDVQREMFKLMSGGRTPGGIIAGALMSGLGDLFGIGGGFDPIAARMPTGSAQGNAFLGGRVIPFAGGGVVASPTAFPLVGGTGVMGEAGPEAIVPLFKTPSGDLGVRDAGGSRAPHVTITQVFQPGVGRAELAAILPALRAQTVAAVRELRLRDPEFFGRG